ncbi:glutamine amidotransferase-related protein [Sodalis sp. RH14]|uniref:glutamine amidotransferase-related protein n=1 Tax=Sodalis sp. RH14 TaxID=3394329 RepID=UPI0039B3A3BB
MTLLFVAHDTPEPALYGAMAAILARRLRLPLAHLAIAWDTALYPDACQHAIAAGALVTSGLIWHERLSGDTIDTPKRWSELAALPAGRDWVIPLGPAQLAELPGRLRALSRLAVDYQLIRVDMSPQGLVFRRNGAIESAWGQWRRDGFGRWRETSPDDAIAIVPGVAPTGALPAVDPGPGIGRDAPVAAPHSLAGAAASPLAIVLLGARRDQLEAYPAAVAALGDAADALALRLNILFASPQEPCGDILKRAHGVLLPGGAAMANVAGQITAARYTLDNAVPTLGLCLGMQTMATAVAQRMLGSTGVNLAEADPLAPVKSFVPLAETAGLPRHRLGDHMMVSEPGSRMHQLLGDRSTLRYNHRFHLNPALKRDLDIAGLRLSATDASGAITDGIEFTRHVFYLGVQGHPELSSSRRRPHPLLMAFLTAAARRREARL